MKTAIILLVSFLMMPSLLADAWRAEITKIDKRGKNIVVSYSIYRDDQFLSTSAVHLPFDEANSDYVLVSIEEQLSQMAFNTAKIIEPPDFLNKFNAIKSLKGLSINVNSEILTTQKIPSERRRLEKEVREAERQTEREANAPKHLKREQDKLAGMAKLIALGLTDDQVNALFGD